MQLQIAGNACKVCGQNITLSTEGKFCAHCETVVHIACESRDKCEACGRSYQCYERPKFDPLADAVVPRALRPAKSAGPALALSVVVILTAIIVVIWYALTHARGK